MRKKTVKYHGNNRIHPKSGEEDTTHEVSQIMDVYDQIHQLNLVFFHNMMSRCYHILYRIQRRCENVSKREFKGGNQLNICLLLGWSIKIRNGDRLRFLKLFYDDLNGNFVNLMIKTVK